MAPVCLFYIEIRAIHQWCLFFSDLIFGGVHVSFSQLMVLATISLTFDGLTFISCFQQGSSLQF